MRIHHLNCGTMCPVGGALMYGRAEGPAARLVCHCLLIETEAHGLVLVDTGFGRHDIVHPAARLPHLWQAMLRMRLDPAETAVAQVERLGFRREDVRHIVVTHLDFDHAGGLDDFPQATVHVYGAEVQAAQYRNGFVERRRYQPEQWHTASHWRLYRPHGERWFGFDAVRDLDGLPPEILMVPLVGHTWGHCGVAVQHASGWLLHAGDAYFFRGEMDVARPWCTPGLEGYQRLMEVNRPSRLHNQRRLRELRRYHGDAVTLTCAHDPVELMDLAEQSERGHMTFGTEADPRRFAHQH